jgi:DNA-binding CsgD family transcriptional regulator
VGALRRTPPRGPPRLVPTPSDQNPQLPKAGPPRGSSVVASLGRLPAPLLTIDGDARITWLNDAASASFDAGPGTQFSRIVAPELRSAERARFARMFLGGRESGTHATLLLLGGEKVEADLATVAVRDAEGVAVAAVLVLVRSTGHPVEPGRRPLPRLTPRQHQVLRLLADDASTVRIAAELGVADDTARNHVRLLLHELGVHSRLGAVVAAYRNGWV